MSQQPFALIDLEQHYDKEEVNVTLGNSFSGGGNCSRPLWVFGRCRRSHQYRVDTIRCVLDSVCSFPRDGAAWKRDIMSIALTGQRDAAPSSGQNRILAPSSSMANEKASDGDSP